MFKHLDSYDIVLASNSPRRKELLKEVGVTFRIQSSRGEETYPQNLVVENVAEYLAKQKADWFDDFSNNQLYITADTVVILEGEVLGKPTDANDASLMLQNLSGKRHKVVTGICLKSKNKQISSSVETYVQFRKLTAMQIEYYVNNYKPFDKAGSYGIQEWIGMIGIEKIEGSYFNVVGMPTQELFNELIQF